MKQFGIPKYHNYVALWKQVFVNFKLRQNSRVTISENDKGVISRAAGFLLNVQLVTVCADFCLISAESRRQFGH